MIDKEGRKAAFTGRETRVWKGHLTGDDYVVAGNLLVGAKVVEAMAHTFERSEARLAERLVKALEAGQEAGGDRRGKLSAALLATGARHKKGQAILDLRVDRHENPVRELRRIFESYQIRDESQT